MKKYLILFLLCSVISAYSQDFDVQVSKFRNTCTGRTTKDMREPQMRWNLSSHRAEFCVVSRYDKTQRDSWKIFNVKKVTIEDNNLNGKAFIYAVSSYKYGNGTLIYVPGEKFLKLTLEASDCEVNYSFF